MHLYEASSRHQWPQCNPQTLPHLLEHGSSSKMAIILWYPFFICHKKYIKSSFPVEKTWFGRDKVISVQFVEAANLHWCLRPHTMQICNFFTNLGSISVYLLRLSFTFNIRPNIQVHTVNMSAETTGNKERSQAVRLIVWFLTYRRWYFQFHIGSQTINMCPLMHVDQLTVQYT